MLTMAFGESTMSRTQLQLWYNRFEKAEKSTSTTDKNIKAVKKMMLDNRQITDDVGIPFGSCQAIFANI